MSARCWAPSVHVNTHRPRRGCVAAPRLRFARIVSHNPTTASTAARAKVNQLCMKTSANAATPSSIGSVRSLAHVRRPNSWLMRRVCPPMPRLLTDGGVLVGTRPSAQRRTLRGTSDRVGLLPERESQVGVDQLVEALPHVAYERLCGSWFLYMKGPSEIGAAAEARW